MRDGFHTFPSGTPDVWMYTYFIIDWSYFITDWSVAIGDSGMRNFAVEVQKWVDKIMDHHMHDLGTAAMWEWYKAKDRYPTRQQWEALNPSHGQSYQPFSLPRPPR